MSPTDYERLCAELLKRAGWTATLTPSTGDQGADIIAEKNGRRLALQCKLYGRPVGNKAVQEAHAAKIHFRADWGAVVTNRTFTPSAQQLARSTNTVLLHHTELAELAERLPHP